MQIHSPTITSRHLMAAQIAWYGSLHVRISSDATVHGLKARWPVNDAQERKYMPEASVCMA